MAKNGKNDQNGKKEQNCQKLRLLKFKYLALDDIPSIHQILN